MLSSLSVNSSICRLNMVFKIQYYQVIQSNDCVIPIRVPMFFFLDLFFGLQLDNILINQQRVANET